MTLGEVAVAGGLLALWPQHVESIVRLLLASIAMAAAGIAVRRWWAVSRDDPRLALDVSSPPAVPRQEPPGLAAARTAITSVDKVRADVRPLNWPTIARLRALANTSLRRHGVDGDDPLANPVAGRLLSPETYRTLTAKRPAVRTRGIPLRTAAPDDVARSVHDILDELERLDGAISERHG